VPGADRRLTDSGDDADLEETGQVTTDSGGSQLGDVGRTDGRLDTDTESLLVERPASSVK
jgi:hypothetical protein